MEKDVKQAEKENPELDAPEPKVRKPFSRLTPKQVEQLALLSEELGEAQQVIGKILRHGYESRNPNNAEDLTNRDLLTQECGDVVAAIQLLADAHELDADELRDAKVDKLIRVRKWLHHKDDPK